MAEKPHIVTEAESDAANAECDTLYDAWRRETERINPLGLSVMLFVIQVLEDIAAQHSGGWEGTVRDVVLLQRHCNERSGN